MKTHATRIAAKALVSSPALCIEDFRKTSALFTYRKEQMTNVITHVISPKGAKFCILNRIHSGHSEIPLPWSVGI